MYLTDGGVVTTAPITVNVIGALTANCTFTSIPDLPVGQTVYDKCTSFSFVSTSIGTIVPPAGTTGYSWLINGVNYNTSSVNSIILPPGTNPVTLGVVNVNPAGATVASNQISKDIRVSGVNAATDGNKHRRAVYGYYWRQFDAGWYRKQTGSL